ncbi:hypothetical protein FGO68_gene8575 [Halteria grandinella]|uniref:Uncharacterized protein n=1 Tax=Halteria grandinella TaxID=5974 RepID=A0A8J8T1S5_HALGN|nr:hypothetical protein FGO68_gene8575 [Halteria grandinella]
MYLFKLILIVIIFQMSQDNNKKPDQQSTTNAATDALNQVLSPQTQSEFKSLGHALWDMVVDAPKDQEDYKIKFRNVTGVAHRMLTRALPQFTAEQLEPIHALTYVPHKLLTYRDNILRDCTFEQRYRYVQLFSVGAFFFRGWVQGPTCFFATIGLGAYYFAPELYSPFFRQGINPQVIKQEDKKSTDDNNSTSHTSPKTE